MTPTLILAVIGGIAVTLTAAARIPAALAELLRACIPVAAAVREVRAAFSGAPPRAERDESASAHDHAPPPGGHSKSVEGDTSDPGGRRP